VKALLDTHAFLWAIAKDRRLSLAAERVFTGPSDLLLSVASVWEVLSKVHAGKLRLPEPSGPYLVKELRKNKIEVLPINLDHVLRLESLELHHRDPFDRMLIAQGITEKIPIVTGDPMFARYPVELIW
jgi:PIN domain nuclease of toxin-antitoxin system